MGLTIL